METIYKVIQENPGFFAWSFAIVNFLWGSFLYFNKKSHDKELLQIKHNLGLEKNRRTKKYELKIAQFEKYFQMIDDFGKKHQNDFAEKVLPYINKFFSEYLSASDKSNNEAKTKAIVDFSSNINLLLADGNLEYNRMKSESSGLKLIASDELVKLYENTLSSYEDSLKSLNDLMDNFVDLFVSDNQDELNKFQSILQEKGQEITNSMSILRNKMREEIDEI